MSETTDDGTAIESFAALLEETGTGRHHHRPAGTDPDLLRLLGVTHRLARVARRRLAAPSEVAERPARGSVSELLSRLMAEYSVAVERIDAASRTASPRPVRDDDHSGAVAWPVNGGPRTVAPRPRRGADDLVDRHHARSQARRRENPGRTDGAAPPERPHPPCRARGRGERRPRPLRRLPGEHQRDARRHALLGEEPRRAARGSSSRTRTPTVVSCTSTSPASVSSRHGRSPPTPWPAYSPRWIGRSPRALGCSSRPAWAGLGERRSTRVADLRHAAAG